MNSSNDRSGHQSHLSYQQQLILHYATLKPALHSPGILQCSNLPIKSQHIHIPRIRLSGNNFNNLPQCGNGTFVSENSSYAQKVIHKMLALFPVAHCDHKNVEENVEEGTTDNKDTLMVKMNGIADMVWDELAGRFCDSFESVRSYWFDPKPETEVDEDVLNRQHREKVLAKRREDLLNSIVVTPEEVQEYLDNETGRDRIRVMYTAGPNGEMSQELFYPYVITVSTMLLTFFMGGLKGGSEAKELFLLQNKHTKWRSRFRAVRAMQDTILLNALTTGAKHAGKYGIFIGIISLTAESLSVYYNRSNPVQYAAGGGLAGCVYRISMGPRGMFAGSLVGAVLGFFGGLSLYFGQYFTGARREEMYSREIVNKITQERFLTAQFLPHKVDDKTEEIAEETEQT